MAVVINEFEVGPTPPAQEPNAGAGGEREPDPEELMRSIAQRLRLRRERQERLHAS